MMIKKIVSFVAFVSIVFPAFCQDGKREIYKKIDDTLKCFFSDIGAITKPTDPDNPELFAKDYQGNFFFYNGKQSTILDFFNSYKNNVKSYYIPAFLRTSITRKEADTNLYIVEGLLKRDNTSEEDYRVKDEKIRLEVYWESGESDNVKIMRIEMPTEVTKVFPKYSQKYSFNIADAKIHINSMGGKWTLVVDSWRWQEKTYPGISEEPERFDSVRIAFDVTPSNSLFNQGKTMTIDDSSHAFGDELMTNNSKESRKIVLSLVQKESGNKVDSTITQDGKEVFDPFRFRLTSSGFFMDIRIHYMYEIGAGVSFMITPKYWRWSFGLLLVTNGNNLRDYFNGNDLSSSSSAATTQSPSINISNEKISITPGGSEKEINGYKIIETTYNPGKDNYEEVENYASNEIDHYTAKLLLMTNTGCFVNDWSRVSLGIGAIRKRDFTHYNKAYLLNKYSYYKMGPDLPNIPDIYEPVSTKEDFWIKKEPEWLFTMRPAIDFFVPIGKNTHISAGFGYTIVAKSTFLSSLDLSLGIAFNF